MDVDIGATNGADVFLFHSMSKNVQLITTFLDGEQDIYGQKHDKNGRVKYII